MFLKFLHSQVSSPAFFFLPETCSFPLLWVRKPQRHPLRIPRAKFRKPSSIRIVREVAAWGDICAQPDCLSLRRKTRLWMRGWLDQDVKDLFDRCNQVPIWLVSVLSIDTVTLLAMMSECAILWQLTQIAFEVRNDLASGAHSRISGDSAIGDMGLDARLVFFPELRLRDSFFGFG
jgi:hypothetical protein